MLNATLYLDNFRGFRDQFIPLRDVNFLVGENSTGKTSLLQLVYLLMKRDWWYSFDFNLEYSSLGSFYEFSDRLYNKNITIGLFSHLEKGDIIFPDTYLLLRLSLHNKKISIVEVKALFHKQIHYFRNRHRESLKLSFRPIYYQLTPQFFLKFNPKNYFPERIEGDKTFSKKDLVTIQHPFLGCGL